MRDIIEESSHHLPIKEILDVLGVDPERGLDIIKVRERQEDFGRNVLSPRKEKPAILRFLLQFHQPLVYILLVCGIALVWMNEIVDASVVFGVTIVNSIIGFIQEGKAVRAIHALGRSLASNAIVLRGGRKEMVPAEELVPGDIVILHSGDRIPADLRLVKVRDLQVAEGTFTGESLPVQKGAGHLPKETPLSERTNMAFSSTLVTYGTANGVVVATGDDTEIGRLSDLIANVPSLQTPLMRKMERFSFVLLVAILGIAFLTFAVGVLRGQPTAAMFMAAVALAVGAIPEGLPAALTIIMAIGVSRMAQRRAIIRRLPAVETLGSTTVICSDKTGTLTQNQMTVQRIYAGGEWYEVTGGGYSPEGKIRKWGERADPAHFPPLRECLLAGLLCNDSEVVGKDGVWEANGDPTEAALIVSAAKGRYAHDEAVMRMPRLDAIPFESQHQYMATLNAGEGRHPPVAYVKGSVESILSRCHSAFGAKGEVAIDRKAIHKEVDVMADEGMRVLAFAMKEMPEGMKEIGHGDVKSGLVFLGLQGMMDPPRHDVEKAVATCQEAGISVKMITGDHPATAAAIAGMIGIEGRRGERGLEALTGAEIAEMDDERLLAAADEVAVFARVAPEQKLRLVEALQMLGHVVAMTGDGVNDAPALRKADIGVAMGQGGTEVARDASDMVLTDDNFATIGSAVEEGRVVYDNIQKFLVWTLPTNVAEALVTIAAIFLGINLPMLPLHLLWINMMTAVCLGTVLAFEVRERNIMKQPPHPPKTPILTRFLLAQIVLVSVLICSSVYLVHGMALAVGASVAEAQTTAVAMIVFGELAYLFNCRSIRKSFLSMGLFSNRWFWPGVAAMIAIQLVFTYLPLANRIFRTAPMRFEAWGWVFLLGLCISLLVGLEKYLLNAVAGKRFMRAISG